ncbi:MAG: hypothetical protein VX501_00550 [Pseudomonadota bacterium]|nr:hypothetical protein [Pseudomonadota bacterium]
MIRLIAEAYLALDGALKALTFKPGWEAEFDVSMTGFWHSFLAIIPASLCLAIIYVGAAHAGSPPPLGALITIFAVSWVLFPGAAAIVSVVLGVKDRFVPWVILHNWTVIWLWMFLAGMSLLRTAGLAGQDLYEFVMFLYIYLRFLVHWRVAYVSLGVPTITSALGAAVPLVMSYIAQVLVYQALVPASAG